MARICFCVTLTPDASKAMAEGRLNPTQQHHVWDATGAAVVKATAMQSVGTCAPQDARVARTVEQISFHAEQAEPALNLTAV